jgi:uncharacterized protein
MGWSVIDLDASTIVAFFVEEAHSADSNMLIFGQESVASPLSLAGASNAMTRRVRMKEVLISDALKIFQDWDVWANRSVMSVGVRNKDFTVAEALTRRLDLGLRTPDALHIAIAGRVGARHVTFDAKMANAATTLGLDVKP